MSVLATYQVDHNKLLSQVEKWQAAMGGRLEKLQAVVDEHAKTILTMTRAINRMEMDSAVKAAAVDKLVLRVNVLERQLEERSRLIVEVKRRTDSASQVKKLFQEPHRTDSGLLDDEDDAGSIKSQCFESDTASIRSRNHSRAYTPTSSILATEDCQAATPRCMPSSASSSIKSSPLKSSSHFASPAGGGGSLLIPKQGHSASRFVAGASMASTTVGVAHAAVTATRMRPLDLK